MYCIPAAGDDVLVELEELLQHLHRALLGGDMGRRVAVLKITISLLKETSAL